MPQPLDNFRLSDESRTKRRRGTRAHENDARTGSLCRAFLSAIGTDGSSVGARVTLMQRRVVIVALQRIDRLPARIAAHRRLDVAAMLIAFADRLPGRVVTEARGAPKGVRGGPPLAGRPGTTGRWRPCAATPRMQRAAPPPADTTGRPAAPVSRGALAELAFDPQSVCHETAILRLQHFCERVVLRKRRALRGYRDDTFSTVGPQVERPGIIAWVPSTHRLTGGAARP
jgi:hypothetical protein